MNNVNKIYSCELKHKHISLKSAFMEMGRLHYYKKMSNLNVYECKYCQSFHVGHKK